MSETDDLERLLSRVASADRPAFEKLYQLTSAKLFGICLRILKSRPLAEEALQEAFVKVWRNAGRYDASVARPITWLAVIARNQALDRLRAVNVPHKGIDEAVEIADLAPTPESNAIMSDEMQRLEECLGELEPKHATALRRAYLDGWTYQEAADKLEVPLGTVKTWVRRSLGKLKDCLSR